MTQPSFALLVTIRVRPESIDDFRTHILQAASLAVREEEHCHRFEVTQDEEAADTFVLYEVYTDASALEHHHTTPHFLAFAELARDWVVDKSRRRLNICAR
ncbi:MAG: autoinducer 2-degrading protein [Planctomycetota bacterium]|jgi:autoinducer 2-degrading protein